MALLTIIARILLASVFVGAALRQIQDYTFFDALMTAHRIPHVEILLPLAIVVQIVGSLMLATGYQGRLGAALLIGFLIPATLVFHTSLVLPLQPGPFTEFAQQSLARNLSILGGLILVLVNGPGAGSLGARRRR